MAGTGPERTDGNGLVGDPQFHDERLMPFTMGSPYRVAKEFYEAWGLVYEGEAKADAAYRAEWAAGNEGQLGVVKEATIRAGLGNYPDLLNIRTAEAVHRLLSESGRSSVKFIDIGSAGGTTVLAIYQALPDHLKDGAEFVLVDPSPRALKSAEETLTERGIRFEIREGSDSDVLRGIPEGSFDILTGVASIHHHAEPPFNEYLRVLKKGGSAFFGDWHDTMWRSPASVYHDFLLQMDWPRREEGLRDWLRAYPQAVEVPIQPAHPHDRQANTDIAKFWGAYQELQDPGTNAIYPLEGHRLVGMYALAMRQAGFDLETREIDRLVRGGIIDRNPHQILPDSSLLQLTIGQKPYERARIAA